MSDQVCELRFRKDPVPAPKERRRDDGDRHQIIVKTEDKGIIPYSWDIFANGRGMWKTVEGEFLKSSAIVDGWAFLPGKEFECKPPSLPISKGRYQEMSNNLAEVRDWAEDRAMHETHTQDIERLNRLRDIIGPFLDTLYEVVCEYGEE